MKDIPERIYVNISTGSRGFKCFSEKPDIKPLAHNVEFIRSDLCHVERLAQLQAERDELFAERNYWKRIAERIEG